MEFLGHLKMIIQGGGVWSHTGLCLGRWTNIDPCLAPLSRPDRKKLLYLVDIDSNDFITTIETLRVNFSRGDATPEVFS